MLETLEERAVPAAFVVTTTADTGTTGSLRWAIQQVNASLDASNIIDFAIGALGSRQTLTLANHLLPSITKSVTIDGYSQGSSSSGPLIQLDGTGTMMIDGLISLSGGVIIQDLAIYNFQGNGIVLNTSSSGGSDIVRGCYLGTDAAGSSGKGDLNGVDILGGLYNTIGGPQITDRNVISGNRQSGVLDWGGGSVLQNNYIGVTPNGLVALGIAVDGIDNEANGMTASSNLISANQQDGIYAAGYTDLVTADWIGVDASGKNALPNGTGVVVTGANDTIGDATGATINLISGNTNDGVDVSGANATGAQIISDWMGVDVSGLVGLGNGLDGLSAAAGAAFGAVKKTVISGHRNGKGVKLSANGWSVLNNYIGVDKYGATPVGNKIGVYLDSNANNCIIGRSNAGDGNIITGNVNDGIRIEGSTGTQVANNYIGVDINGNVSNNGQIIGNGGSGVVITNDIFKTASGNTIGGALPKSPATAGAGYSLTAKYGTSSQATLLARI
jgi:hypothetical protein